MNPETGYAEAFKRIEACRTGKERGRLDLIGLMLTTLPPEMRQLTALTTLYLHENAGLGLPVDMLGRIFIVLVPCQVLIFG